MANTDTTASYSVTVMTGSAIELVADRLFSAALSSIATVGPNEREDMILASRCLRRLLSAYERGTGRELTGIVIEGC